MRAEAWVGDGVLCESSGSMTGGLHDEVGARRFPVPSLYLPCTFSGYMMKWVRGGVRGAAGWRGGGEPDGGAGERGRGGETLRRDGAARPRTGAA